MRIPTCFIALAAFLSVASGHVLPEARDTTEVNDTTILNYALTLEHLENTFYAQGLANFSADDFTSAGFPSWARGRVAQIAQHEAAHVAFLSNALGDQATQPCTYNL